ncbi:MAG: type I-E CRISPR-associated protein Cse2/CasB [Planctomycetes bacterium]|nr:type I-E CRISPR-associated protein Cse2/CasB [Planctomycetota bacterium]
MSHLQPTAPLVSHLLELAQRDDRRALAALRRSLAPDCEAAAYPIVARFFPRDRRPKIERAILTVAGLFALHPLHGSCTLGGALRRSTEKRRSQSIESRFVAMLDASFEDVGQHLRQLVAILATEGIGLDWSDLLRALKNWDFDENWARRDWAKDFWGSVSEENQEKEPQS